jgi:hypothetical protein
MFAQVLLIFQRSQISVPILVQVGIGHDVEDIPMIVERQVLIVKRGKMNEVLEIVKAEQVRVQQAYGVSGASRNYVPYVGPFNQIVLEYEWNDMAEREAFWSAWEASPEAKAIWKKWEHLLEPGGGVELWRLV